MTPAIFSFRIEVACQCAMPLGLQSKVEEEREMTLCG